MEDDLAHGSARAGADRANVDYLRDEVARSRTRLESAQLRSPIAGIVVTPNLQNVRANTWMPARFCSGAGPRLGGRSDCVPEQDASLIAPASLRRSNWTAIRNEPGTIRCQW